MALRTTTSTNALRIFCALVFLSLGMVHKPVFASFPVDAFSETYRLPDGSFADICADSNGHSNDAVSPVCEVCLLAASTLLPSPPAGIGVPLENAYLVNPLPVTSLQVGFTAFARPMSRGPPRLV